MKLEDFVMDDMWFLNDNLSSITNPRFLEEWEGEIIMLFRVKFGKEVSEVDMLSTVVLEELISSLLESSHNLMELAHSINSELMVLWEFIGKKVNSWISSVKYGSEYLEIS